MWRGGDKLGDSKEGVSPAHKPIFAGKVFCSSLALHLGVWGRDWVCEVLFEALQVYIGVPGPESGVLRPNTAQHARRGASTSYTLIAHLYEGGFTRLDTNLKKSVFGRFRPQKATFGPRDPYVDLQGFGEHLTDPVSTPNTQVSGELGAKNFPGKKGL